MMSRVSEVERALDLPGYTLVSLRESGDAFAHGLAIAVQAGAGTLISVGRYDLVEFAVVLEPAEQLVSARRALFVGMNATADAIAAHCPPEREVSFAWPDSIFFDGGLLGGMRLGWPKDCAETDVPAWLVLGVMLRAVDLVNIETGATPGSVSLMGEGFEMVQTDAIIGSFARHLMIGFDLWNEAGFDPVASNYLARLPKCKAGERRGIDRNGDLLVNVPLDTGAPDRSSLREGLSRAAWYDPRLRGPRLA
ncbi:MAG: biotin/lipoate--protein ligase family protein [Bradyrhizobium sp.]